jgi:predicted O-methyltransferase YrrM
MNAFKEYANYISSYKNWEGVSIDFSHSFYVFGLVTSLKPTKVLEIGMGAGFVTNCLLYAIDYNQHGKLTCVDNWYDWQGTPPEYVKGFEQRGAKIITSDEYNFVSTCEDTYDLIFSDGNHNEGGNWVPEIFKLLNKNGVLFAHDIRMERYPTLVRYEEFAKEMGYSYICFDKNTLSHELCQRGLIMIYKDK